MRQGKDRKPWPFGISADGQLREKLDGALRLLALLCLYEWLAAVVWGSQALLAGAVVWSLLALRLRAAAGRSGRWLDRHGQRAVFLAWPVGVVSVADREPDVGALAYLGLIAAVVFALAPVGVCGRVRSRSFLRALGSVVAPPVAFLLMVKGVGRIADIVAAFVVFVLAVGFAPVRRRFTRRSHATSASAPASDWERALAQRLVAAPLVLLSRPELSAWSHALTAHWGMRGPWFAVVWLGEMLPSPGTTFRARSVLVAGIDGTGDVESAVVAVHRWLTDGGETNDEGTAPTPVDVPTVTRLADKLLEPFGESWRTWVRSAVGRRMKPVPTDLRRLLPKARVPGGPFGVEATALTGLPWTAEVTVPSGRLESADEATRLADVVSASLSERTARLFRVRVSDADGVSATSTPPPWAAPAA